MIHDGAALPAFSFEFISILANAPAHFFVIFCVCFFFFLGSFCRKRWWRDGDATLSDLFFIIVVIIISRSKEERQQEEPKKSCGGNGGGPKDLRGVHRLWQKRQQRLQQWLFFSLHSARCSSAWREDEAVQVQTARWRFHHSRPISCLSSITNGVRSFLFRSAAQCFARLGANSSAAFVLKCRCSNSIQ